MLWLRPKSKNGRLASSILCNWYKNQPRNDHYALFDPLAIAASLQPNLLKFKETVVNIETAAIKSRCKTMFFYNDSLVSVAISVDVTQALNSIKRLLEIESL